jgi:hypothetical protein
MAKFFGQVNGGRGTATRVGHRNIRASAQSYDGSVQTELTYNDEGKLMVRVDTSECISYYGSMIFYGTFEEFVAKLKA